MSTPVSILQLTPHTVTGARNLRVFVLLPEKHLRNLSAGARKVKMDNWRNLEMTRILFNFSCIIKTKLTDFHLLFQIMEQS